jgi:Ras-related protein Rab-4B
VSTIYPPGNKKTSHPLLSLVRSVTRSYYRGASACLLVYDITKRATFETLGRWLVDARALASPDLVVVVVGNKLDREEEREVGYVEASRWAGENGESIKSRT